VNSSMKDSTFLRGFKYARFNKIGSSNRFATCNCLLGSYPGHAFLLYFRAHIRENYKDILESGMRCKREDYTTMIGPKNRDDTECIYLKCSLYSSGPEALNAAYYQVQIVKKPTSRPT
jgi:hypothetical protein